MTAAAAARRKRLTAAIVDNDLDVLVLFGNAWQNEYLRYAADFGLLEGEAVAVVTRDGETTLFLDHHLEAERAAFECHGFKTRLASNLISDVTDFVRTLSRNSHVAAAPGRYLPFGVSRRLHQWTDATSMIDRLLMVKAKEELDAIRGAAHLADEGYAVFRKAARPGRADYELVAEIEAFFRSSGVDDNFMLMGVGGPDVRGMTPPTGRVIAEGDLVITELTPCVDGYYVQICRTLVVGEPSEVQQKAFQVFLEAMEAGIAAVKPGVTAADVAKAENDIFRRYGLGDYVTSEYTRVRGHGLGLSADAKPQILESVKTRIEPGMTLIVHPNTYHPDAGYMVLGDLLIVGADGIEVLTKTPRSLLRASISGDDR